MSQHSYLSQVMLLDAHQCTIDKLTHLPAKVLWPRLSSRHLVTSRSKSVMAQRLYHASHIANNSPLLSLLYTLSPMPTSLTSTATSYPSTMMSSVPLTIPHLLFRHDHLFPCLRCAYCSTFSCCFLSFLLARVAVAAVLPYKSINPTSKSHHIQPNHACKARSITCLYSGPTSNKYAVTCSCSNQSTCDNQ